VREPAEHLLEGKIVLLVLAEEVRVEDLVRARDDAELGRRLDGARRLLGAALLARRRACAWSIFEQEGAV
jgi:hypothetical protein